MRHEVKCTKCQSTAIIELQETNLAPPFGKNISWIKQNLNNKGRGIVSGRQRLDSLMGWQCSGCGNDSLMTNQERKTIKNLQAPRPEELAEIVKNMVMPRVVDSPQGLLVDGFLLKKI